MKSLLELCKETPYVKDETTYLAILSSGAEMIFA